MVYNINKRILFNGIILAILCNYCLYSQNCSDGFTYIENIPENVNNMDNDSNCFFNNDLDVLNDLISLNNLDNYNSALELGPQAWVAGRITSLYALYTQGGSNGITQQIDQLPDNFGQVDSLAYLVLKNNNITGLPDSFTELSNLNFLKISNNWLISLPENIGNLISLETLDLGYNQLESIPESIGDLLNLEYLYLFNNQLSSLPETICDLPLDWNGTNAANKPYFAIGGNYLCDSDLIPDCVENSDNFNISMEEFYYSFLMTIPQICCPDLGNINGDVDEVGQPVWNVLDIVMLANCVLAQNCDELPYSCAGDMNGDGGYNVLDIVTLANCVLAGTCDG